MNLPPGEKIEWIQLKYYFFVFVFLVDRFYLLIFLLAVSNLFPISGFGGPAAFASLYNKQVQQQQQQHQHQQHQQQQQQHQPSTSIKAEPLSKAAKRAAAKQAREEKRAQLAFQNSINPSLMFTCDMCGQKFARMKQLHQHKYRHHNKQKWQCHVCDKEYSSKLTLNQHLITHSPSLIRYWCDNCHKGFYDKSKYKSHVRSHAKKAEHICNICGKKFSTKFNLQRHEKCKEHLEHLGNAPAGATTTTSAQSQAPPPQQQQQQQPQQPRHAANPPPSSMLPPDHALSLSQAILMTNGPSHIHETAGYASHFMAHLAWPHAKRHY